jgi:hypothetical protein
MWGYGSGGKFSFIVYQEMDGTASALYHAVAREKVKGIFLFQMSLQATCCPQATGWVGLL